MKVEKILATIAGLSMVACFFSAYQSFVYVLKARPSMMFAFITSVQCALLVTAGIFLGALLIVSIKDIMDNKNL